MGRSHSGDNECSKRFKKISIVLSISLLCISIVLVYALNHSTNCASIDNNLIMNTNNLWDNSTNTAYSSASATIVMEAESKLIVGGSNYGTKLPMASTTKVLTAYIACISGRLDEIISISKLAVGIEGSSIYLREGERITLRDLVYGLMLRSGNDSAVAIAIAISGSIDEFATLMNRTAKDLGANNSNFTNPHGLHNENHYTTAYDLALITSNALSNKDFRQVCSTKMHVVKSDGQPDRYLANKNKMLNMYEGAIGVKTGYTIAAGRCLVSAAERNGLTVVAVVLNIPDMWEQSMTLLNKAFNELKRVELVAADTELIKVRIPKSDIIMPIAVREGYHHIASWQDELDINYKVEFNKNLSYPISRNVNLGKFSLFNGKRLIFESNIYSMIDIQGKGVFPHCDSIEEWINLNYGAIN